MAAESLTTAATLFAGPGITTNSTPAVNDSATFRLVLDGTVQTLSTQNTPDKGPIKGLFFVPGLDSHDPCTNTTAPYVPANVTRYEDVESFGYNTIGLAPWVNLECTLAFLNASRHIGPEALVFYVPSSNETKPPPSNDPTWALGDGDSWKTRNKHPVYAIPGPAGATLMQQLSWYSGNTSNVSATFLQDKPGETRLFALIELERAEKKMPSLWGFILAIVGTILVLSIILLLCYQIVQKRRRERLQRRIESGETDIENLGLHQLKVPQAILDTMPIYTYPDLSALSDSDSHSKTQSGDEVSIRSVEEKEETRPETKDETRLSVDESKPPEQTKEERREVYDKEDGSHIEADISLQSAITLSDNQPANRSRLSHSQTTCAICLDDFVPHESIVRELPCGHIFHAECIDTFLTQSGSLCPLCKKTVLPPGCYPVPITNRMVHMDYVMRRAR